MVTGQNYMKELIDKWEERVKDWRNLRINSTNWEYKNIYAEREVTLETAIRELKEAIKNGV